MAPISLSYEEELKKTTDLLMSQHLGVLATAEGTQVTARQMVIICDGRTVSFVTTIYTRKYKQILANQNVALSIGNIQIEGIATIKGHPGEEKRTDGLLMLCLRSLQKNGEKSY